MLCFKRNKHYTLSPSFVRVPVTALVPTANSSHLSLPLRGAGLNGEEVLGSRKLLAPGDKLQIQSCRPPQRQLGWWREGGRAVPGGSPPSRLLCHRHWDQLSVERRMRAATFLSDPPDPCISHWPWAPHSPGCPAPGFCFWLPCLIFLLPTRCFLAKAITCFVSLCLYHHLRELFAWSSFLKLTALRSSPGAPFLPYISLTCYLFY